MTCERAATKLGLLLGQWNTRLRLPEARYGAVDSALRAKSSGGGENRTPVRNAKPTSIYMFILTFNLA